VLRQGGDVVALVSTTSRRHLRENLDVLDYTLHPEQVRQPHRDLLAAGRARRPLHQPTDYRWLSRPGACVGYGLVPVILLALCWFLPNRH
jgi:hypothetical protein